MESLITHAGAPSSRRDFFKRAGLGAGVLAAASTLQACDNNGDTDVPPAATVRLDFSNDFGVLNYAYALEQLEAAFYAMVIADGAFATTFNGDEQGILRSIAAHEAVHDDFLRTALGTNAIPRLTVDFSAINFASRANVLTAAQTFEDLGVSAYNGAGQYLASDDYLTLAGKIVSVEARHASVIAGLISPNAIAGPGQLNGSALDRDKSPNTVIAAAQTFIAETINVDLP